MSDIIDDYLRDVEANIKANPAERRQIVAELRSHLEEKVEELRGREGGGSREDVARQVIRDMGNPRDLALAYGPGGARLQKPTGEVVLQVGRAVGRGTTTVLKWVAIGLAALLVLGAAAGLWAFYEVKPIVEKNAPYPVYSYDERCGASPCTDGPVSESFNVHGDAREVRMELEVNHAETSAGSVSLRVEDPGGEVKYERTFAATNDRSVHRHTTWSPAAGDWTITYSYTGFQGSVEVDVFAVGLPRDSL